MGYGILVAFTIDGLQKLAMANYACRHHKFPRAQDGPILPSSNQPHRPSLPPLGFIIITRRLLPRAVVRLLHRPGQRNAAARRLSEIAGAQPMRWILVRIEPG